MIVFESKIFIKEKDGIACCNWLLIYIRWKFLTSCPKSKKVAFSAKEKNESTFEHYEKFRSQTYNVFINTFNKYWI